MTDGGDWMSRGRFDSGGYDADDPRYADDFYADAGHSGRPGPGQEAEAQGWTGEFERPGYRRPGPTEGSGDPYGNARYPESAPYGSAAGYGEQGSYGGRYGGQGGYQGGYGTTDDYRDLGGQPGGYGDQQGYDQVPGGRDRNPGTSPYSGDAYQPGGQLGQAGYDPSQSQGWYGREQYGADPYGGQGSYGPDRDVTSDYGPGQRGGVDAQGTQPYRRPGSIGDTGSYGRSGAFGESTGSFGRPDTGSFGRPDTGSFGRPDTGSLGHRDFGRGEARPSRGALPSGSDGYAQWHSDPADQGGWDSQEEHEDSGEDDWAEDADDADDAGSVSRFLSRGGRGDDRDDAGRRGRRPRRLRGGLGLTVAILAGALVLGMAVNFGYEYVHNWITNRYGDYSGSGYGTVRVLVPQGASLSGLGPTLLADNVIMSLRPYDSAANAAQNAANLQPGVYVLHNHMSAALAVAALLNPKNRAKDQVTIIEGWRASEIAGVLAKATGHPVSAFMQIIDHPPASLGLPKWAAGKSAEGFLFPDTYTLLPSMTPLQTLQTMVKDFNHRMAILNLPAIAQQKFTTPYHALIVASLIQAEAGSPGDFKKISRVIWDRLKAGMHLQFDSTVFYAMGKYGTAITRAEESYPSPYNTYLHGGLPPGPIGNPGVAAIQAALHPIDGVTWLYFITDTRHKPYKTYFTSSLTQLQRWQQQFQG